MVGHTAWSEASRRWGSHLGLIESVPEPRSWSALNLSFQSWLKVGLILWGFLWVSFLRRRSLRKLKDPGDSAVNLAEIQRNIELAELSRRKSQAAHEKQSKTGFLANPDWESKFRLTEHEGSVVIEDYLETANDPFFFMKQVIYGLLRPVDLKPWRLGTLIISWLTLVTLGSLLHEYPLTEAFEIPALTGGLWTLAFWVKHYQRKRSQEPRKFLVVFQLFSLLVLARTTAEKVLPHVLPHLVATGRHTLGSFAFSLLYYLILVY